MNGFYLTYSNEAGTFGYCGESETRPPFDCKGHAILFSTRREARASLKHYRKSRGVTNLKHYIARRYAITAVGSVYIQNK